MAVGSIGIVGRYRVDRRPSHTWLTYFGQGATMARMRYVVTGGTGFIGHRVVSGILARSHDAEVWVLVRRASLARFEQLDVEWGPRAKPLVGDLTAADLGLTDEAVAELGTVDHIVHCAAIYDI